VGGLSRKRGRIKPRSPSGLWDVFVFTSIPPVTEIDTTVGRQATHHLEVLQTQERLNNEAQAYGYVSWVVDEAHKLDVVNNETGGAAVVVEYSGSGFTPAVGQDVLLRNPSTGEGFVTRILALPGAGQMTLNLQKYDLDRELVAVDITSGWDILLVAYYFPFTGFERMTWREVPSQGEDKHSLDVQYAFVSESPAVYRTAYARDLT
jgi:hypothetical protein